MPSWSSYSYAFNNPINYTDKDGREPNKSQAGTWQEIRKTIQDFFTANPNRATLYNLRYTENPTGGGGQVGPFGGGEGKRYVYTEKRGWIDLGHFFQVAAQSEEKIGNGFLKSLVKADFNGPGGRYNSLIAGELMDVTIKVEESQSETSDTKWSYEDAPSNYSGLDFFLNYYDSSETLLNNLDKYFESAGASDPSKASNWNQMQNSPQERQFFQRNYSFMPLFAPILTNYGQTHQNSQQNDSTKKKSDSSNSN